MQANLSANDVFDDAIGLASSEAEAVASGMPFPPSLALKPVSRWPLLLSKPTVRAVLSNPIPRQLLRPVERAGTAVRPPVSIVVLTLNGLVYTKLCLDSLLANTDYPEYEVIVVDNGSIDGTPHYLLDLARCHPHVRVLFNGRNLGFAAANNRALALATGEVLVLLNNDTIVPPGWLTRLVAHLAEPGIGLVGPTTNRCGNEAQIETSYRTYGELLRFAADHQRAHEGVRSDLRTAIMFCAAMRRDVFASVGPLDERFEIGMFEDDDYALRVRAAGYRVVCAEDAFVHHFGQASLGHLAASGAYGKLFEANRRRFEEKWRVAWTPHASRPNPAYSSLRDRIRALVQQRVPAGATVLVVSNGDEELVRLDGRRGWHFPRTDDGVYAGHHPADGAAAVAHLEELRARGADYLLVPATAFWWLEHYAEFRRHLDDRCPTVALVEDACRLVALGTGPR